MLRVGSRCQRLREVLENAQSACVVVEAKQSDAGKSLVDYTREAVGQAVAVAASPKYTTHWIASTRSAVRYCTSDGKSWQFGVLCWRGARQVMHEGRFLPVGYYDRDLAKNVRIIVDILCHWVRTRLYFARTPTSG
ncbi:hypothetical protein H0H81_000643 [Sphagnurus paluster]|uniref:Uncharacterized protein n=1 Tax=Sphagnurus paluster TaxID=117069 RepID=A0A9P7FZX9_9AGAR|nr:hypothetical protein H0H81_000643 [Sphagnurus paluster]